MRIGMIGLAWGKKTELANGDINSAACVPEDMDADANEGSCLGGGTTTTRKMIV